jgi:acetolactate synthase-1/2/3 large subunit
MMVNSPEGIGTALKKAFEIPGPVLVGLRVDYRDNHLLFEPAQQRLLM